MKAIISSILSAVLFFSPAANAHEYGDTLPALTHVQDAKVHAFTNALFQLNAVTGPNLPYLCLPSVPIPDEFKYGWYLPVKWHVQHFIYHAWPKSMKRDPLIEGIIWRATLHELGCGSWTWLEAYHPHD